ncbi:hypothetical protein ASG31_00180 [Chryseobacterium sp. Leaf404]|uniref:hypothetical protein n=1 Tax=unclassified Chryseobacterium TaxID=2593645 RepID=UPI0006F79469|nr:MULTISPECIES: hypothetical protein [unclassified Chryseobacterium]KQT21801.1 hypothetical protein ASG31_00180 [Chryseobacterium sp. Leaf404]
MKIITKYIFLALVLLSNFILAQTPQCPTCGTGGGGGTTPGKQSIPVDMYVYVLAAVAVMMVVFFAKKYKSQKI